MRKSSLTLGVMLLAGSAGCDMLRPTLTVKVKAVLPCDQGNALDGVGLMQIKTVDEDGVVQTTTSRKSGGGAKLQNLSVADGTTVFINGFPGEDPGAVDGVPSAVGASIPLDLKAYSDANRFPAARSYPEGSTATVAVPMGRVGSFASTTDVSGGSCSFMSRGRHGHTATFSRASGTVVIIGGYSYADSDGAEAFVPRERALEFYDPGTGTYTTPDIQPANNASLMQRAYHTATELPDGRILVMGGIGTEGDRVSPRAVSFILDPRDLAITTLGPQQGNQIPRFHHQATLVRSGTSVVITGGCRCVGQLTPDRIKAGDCPPVTEPCASGGVARNAAVDVYDVAAQRLSILQTVLDKPRAFHSAVALDNDFIAIIGGDDGIAPIREVEVYRGSPRQELLKPVVDSLDTGAVTHAASVLLNSDDCELLLPQHPPNSECVLVTGGCLSLPANGACSMVQTGSTILDFGKPAGMRRETGPAGNRARWNHQAFNLTDGPNMVLVAGGDFDVQAGDNPPRSAELLPRRANAGAGPVPFASNAQSIMVTPRTRTGAADMGNGLIYFGGGVDPTSTGAITRRSLATSELFFSPSK